MSSARKSGPRPLIGADDPDARVGVPLHPHLTLWPRRRRGRPPGARDGLTRRQECSECPVMGTTKQLPRAEWKDYFDRFTREHLRDDSPGAATIEIMSPTLGDQFEVSSIRLLGLSFDPKSQALEVLLGQRRPPDLPTQGDLGPRGRARLHRDPRGGRPRWHQGDHLRPQKRLPRAPVRGPSAGDQAPGWRQGPPGRGQSSLSRTAFRRTATRPTPSPSRSGRTSPACVRPSRRRGCLRSASRRPSDPGCARSGRSSRRA